MAYFLSPFGNTPVTVGGIPVVGGSIKTYLAGTSTPAETFTDNTGGTSQGVSMTLNEYGLPENGPVWMLGGQPLKFRFFNALGVSILTDQDDISGIGDTASAVEQWTLYGAAPTYISATSFSVAGDQTNIFQSKRKLESINSGGTTYSTIATSSFGAGITTVTVTNTSGVLDSGMSSVSYGLLSVTNDSIPTSIARSGANSDITSLSGVATINSANVAFLPVRQTVLSGPVSSSGLPSFGGSIGSTTVTATGTLIATAANGWVAAGQQNRIGSIVDPSWTSLSTNGTMYLYLDIAADGTCTTGSGTLAPNYRWGGADVVTANQFTFNIQEMVGKVGNGATAAQTYRVYVGEVTVAGGVTTAIVWYALMRRYVSPDQAIPASGTPVTLQHNIGVNAPFCGKVMVYLRNNVGNLNYLADDMIPYASSVDNATIAQTPYISRLATGINGTYGSVGIANKGSGVRAGITDTSWRFVFVIDSVF